jgi:hypothetical protein
VFSEFGFILFLDRTFVLVFRISSSSVVAIEKEVAAEATSDGGNEAIYSVTDTAVVLVADRFPSGEMAVNHCHIDYIIIDLQGRVFKSLKCKFIP